MGELKNIARLRRQPVDVARKQGGFADIRCAYQARYPALESEGAATVGRHAEGERFQIPRERLSRQSAFGESRQVPAAARNAPTNQSAAGPSSAGSATRANHWLGPSNPRDAPREARTSSTPASTNAAARHGRPSSTRGRQLVREGAHDKQRVGQHHIQCSGGGAARRVRRDLQLEAELQAGRQRTGGDFAAEARGAVQQAHPPNRGV